MLGAGPELMRLILILAIASIATSFIALSLLIIANKVRRDRSERWRARRRLELEPLVDRYALGTERPTHGEWELRPKRDRDALEECLLRRIHEAHGVKRERLARVLDRLGFVNGYLEALKSRNGWRRADAAEKLGLALARRAVGRLTAAMEDEVAEVRFRAARALARLGDVRTVGPLIRALDEPNRWSTIRVADVLSTMGNGVCYDLLRGFDEFGTAARIAALDIVASIGTLDDAPWLRERLSDRHSDVRARAAHALGALKDAEAGEPLTASLQDPAWQVRAMAAKALGRIRHAGALPQLCDAMRDRQWWVRANAAEALRAMGKAGENALRVMLDDHDAYARHQAVDKLQDAGVVETDVDHLVDDSDSRGAVARARVSQLIRTGRSARLQELAEIHPDDRVRMMLAMMLRGETGQTDVVS